LTGGENSEKRGQTNNLQRPHHVILVDTSHTMKKQRKKWKKSGGESRKENSTLCNESAKAPARRTNVQLREMRRKALWGKRHTRGESLDNPSAQRKKSTVLTMPSQRERHGWKTCDIGHRGGEKRKRGETTLRAPKRRGTAHPSSPRRVKKQEIPRKEEDLEERKKRKKN